MDIFLSNTLTRKKELFTPITPGKLLMYSCGPTVYNYPHIGNCRAFFFADIVKRVFLYNGYEVTHIMNLTDVDDKTIRDSQKEGKSLQAFTDFYAQEFFKDLESLHILPATRYPKATEHIDEMVTLIEQLIEHGNAYRADDRSTYFSVKSDKTYGTLSGVDTTQSSKSRIANDEYEKDHVQDFALWKAWSPEDGDVFWETPLGKGRPGWHIECSAMSTKYLGNHFDIHTGGVDLIFPHHENEIAQSTCATHEPFVNFWLHNDHVRVDDKKMSKSANNFYTLRDIEAKGYSPIAFRYFLLQSHYKSSVNFTWDALEASSTALKKIQKAVNTLPDGGVVNDEYKTLFLEMVNDDLNTAGGLAVVWELLKNSNIAPEDKKATLMDFDQILGLGLDTIPSGEIDIPMEVQKLLDERAHARDQKDWKQSDALRDKISELGFEVKDTEKGQEIEKK